MEVVKLSEKEIVCECCGSILKITPADIQYKQSTRRDSCGFPEIYYKPYFVCAACKAINYSVPEEFGKADSEEVAFSLRRKYN